SIQCAAGIAAQIEHPATDSTLAPLVENAEHLIDGRRIGEAADLQIADRCVGHLTPDDLVHLYQGALHREFERLRRVQATDLDTDVCSGLAANERGDVADVLPADIL